MATQFSVAQNQTTMIRKKTMGRQKIEIKPIQNKNNLQVTFTKRRGGVFKKASELSVLCNAEIAIIVRSPADKFYTFGNPVVESVLHRFETGSSSLAFESRTSTSSKNGYDEAVKRLEKEKKRSGKELHESFGMNWWDLGFEGMELYELEEFSDALKSLKSEILKKVDEIEKNKVGLEFDHKSGSSFAGFESEAARKYDDWERALLHENGLYNAGKFSSTFGGVNVKEDSDAGCSSSLNHVMTFQTGAQCYVDNGCLENIFKSI